MKPTTKSHKLSLNKQTIMKLEADTQQRIQGGNKAAESFTTFSSISWCFTAECCFSSQDCQQES